MLTGVLFTASVLWGAVNGGDLTRVSQVVEPVRRSARVRKSSEWQPLVDYLTTYGYVGVLPSLTAAAAVATVLLWVRDRRSRRRRAESLARLRRATAKASSVLVDAELLELGSSWAADGGRRDAFDALADDARSLLVQADAIADGLIRSDSDKTWRRLPWGLPLSDGVQRVEERAERLTAVAAAASAHRGEHDPYGADWALSVAAVDLEFDRAEDLFLRLPVAPSTERRHALTSARGAFDKGLLALRRDREASEGALQTGRRAVVGEALGAVSELSDYAATVCTRMVDGLDVVEEARRAAAHGDGLAPWDAVGDAALPPDLVAHAGRAALRPVAGPSTQGEGDDVERVVARLRENGVSGLSLLESLGCKGLLVSVVLLVLACLVAGAGAVYLLASWFPALRFPSAGALMGGLSAGLLAAPPLLIAAIALWTADDGPLRRRAGVKDGRRRLAELEERVAAVGARMDELRLVLVQREAAAAGSSGGSGAPEGSEGSGGSGGSVRAESVRREARLLEAAYVSALRHLQAVDALPLRALGGAEGDDALDEAGRAVQALELGAEAAAGADSR